MTVSVIERDSDGTLRTHNVYLYDGGTKTIRRLDDPYVSESHYYSSSEGKASASDIDYHDPDENSCPSDIYYYKGELYFLHISLVPLAMFVTFWPHMTFKPGRRSFCQNAWRTGRD